MNKKPIVEQITSAPEYKAFMAALEAQRKIGMHRRHEIPQSFWCGRRRSGHAAPSRLQVVVIEYEASAKSISKESQTVSGYRPILETSGLQLRRLCRSISGMVDHHTGFLPALLRCREAAGHEDETEYVARSNLMHAGTTRIAFLENVPGLLASGYFHRILCDLAEGGFDVRWKVLSAAEVGAPHKRDRLWIMADPEGIAERPGLCQDEQAGERGRRSGYCGCEAMENTESERLERRHHGETGLTEKRVGLFFAGSSEHGNTWAVEPDVGRVAHGVASRVDRLKALGNGQVPLCAATAFRILAGQ